MSEYKATKGKDLHIVYYGDVRGIYSIPEEVKFGEDQNFECRLSREPGALADAVPGEWPDILPTPDEVESEAAAYWHIKTLDSNYVVWHDTDLPYQGWVRYTAWQDDYRAFWVFFVPSMSYSHTEVVTQFELVIRDFMQAARVSNNAERLTKLDLNWILTLVVDLTRAHQLQAWQTMSRDVTDDLKLAHWQGIPGFANYFLHLKNKTLKGIFAFDSKLTNDLKPHLFTQMSRGIEDLAGPEYVPCMTNLDTWHWINSPAVLIRRCAPLQVFGRRMVCFRHPLRLATHDNTDLKAWQITVVDVEDLTFFSYITSSRQLYVAQPAVFVAKAIMDYNDGFMIRGLESRYKAYKSEWLPEFFDRLLHDQDVLRWSKSEFFLRRATPEEEAAEKVKPPSVNDQLVLLHELLVGMELGRGDDTAIVMGLSQLGSFTNSELHREIVEFAVQKFFDHAKEKHNGKSDTADLGTTGAQSQADDDAPEAV